MSELFYLDSDNILNRGGSANDNTGDTLRTAALKINTNFQHLDSAVNSVVNSLDTHDSAAVLGQINATVNQSYVDALDTHDSAAVLGQINAVNAADITFGANTTVTSNLTVGGLAKVGVVSLTDADTATYDLSQGNIARWNRPGTNGVSTLTLDGTSGGTIDGTGFSIMAFNGDDSDRTITFTGGTGITVHYNDSSTISWPGADNYTIISGLVYDSANILILSTSLTGSI
jgi:hypothetical protein